MPAQEFEAHRWKDRLLLLFTDDLKNPEYLRQVSQLREDPEALTERSLIVYTLLKDRYARDLPPGNWIRGMQRIPEGLNMTGFYMELIGLDGRVKLAIEVSIPASDLWSLIDGMPMRRAELENKGNP